LKRYNGFLGIGRMDNSDVTYLTISSSEISVGKVDKRRRMDRSLRVVRGCYFEDLEECD
jgi:hypothetical protein